MENEFNDSFENVMPLIKSKSVRMIFADFPYKTTNCHWDKEVDLKLFWKEADRILLYNGIVICTCQFPFTAILAMSNLSNLRYEWIWQKTHPTGHLNAKKMPMKAHENILVFYKKLPIYNPQKTTGHKRKQSVRGKNNCNIYNIQNSAGLEYDSTERYPLSVQIFSSDKQKSNINPTQKPELLIEYFVKTYTNEGDIVLDPCRGSNTTGVVCDRLNRNYIGIEKDLDQFNLGFERRKKALL